MASKEVTNVASPKKIVKKPASQYWNVLLYKTGEAASVLNGLTLAACNPTNEQRLSTTESTKENDNFHVKQREDFTLVSDKMSCGYCNTEFISRPDQIDHYKSDWHRYNLQRSLKGHNPVTESQFDEATGDISSISGSDDSDDNEEEDEADSLTSAQKLQRKINQRLKHVTGSKESGSSDSETDASSVPEEMGRKYPKLFFKNQDGHLISVYRCVVYHKKHQPETTSQLIAMTTNLLQSRKWAVLMASAGHFAAAIFDGNNVLVHKTFHRYVVRAKRGTVQSSRDSQGSAPKSLGASLRRYNEAALKEDITELIKSWEKETAECDLIFLRAPSFNKKIFFSGKSPLLDKHDARIRMIPFATRRPTFNEVKRVHEMLRSVECYGSEAEIQNHVPKAPALIYRPETESLEVLNTPEKLSRSRSPKGKVKDKTIPVVAISTENDADRDIVDVPKQRTLKSGSKIDNLKREESAQSSGNSTASDSELVECMHTLSTSNLKMFDRTKKAAPKKPKNRKRKSSLKHQQSPESNALEEEKYHLKNALYTACKIGDLETLTNLLAVFMEPITSQNISQEIDGQDVTYSETKKLSETDLEVASCKDFEGQFESTSKLNTKHELEFSSEKIIIEGIRQDSQSESAIFPEKPADMVADTEIKKPSMNLNELGKSVQSSPRKSKSRQKIPLEEMMSPVVTSAILNEPIGDRQSTLLHIAAKEAHAKLVWALMEAGADPAISDKYGQTPYSSCDNKEIRNVFRRFMHQFPDKYSYEKAKVPGPLTPEMEAERKKKDAERKKVQRKAKQERMKEVKAQEAIKQAEEAEKHRFLTLSDREKRALAAERRLLQQKTTQGESAPVLSRCFQCGADITGKVPFEYYDFRFCSPKCLKEHRQNTQKR